MKIFELYNILDAKYPKSLSCSWDNDGIMVCRDLDEGIKRVLIALDATTQTINAAAEMGCNLLLTHHPLIFQPIKSLDGRDVTSRRVLLALSRGVSVISLHTRLDIGDGGVADCLANAFNASEIVPLFDGEGRASGRIGRMSDGRIAVFCPGAGGDLVNSAILTGAALFITGELSYNKVLDLSEVMEVGILGHYESEAPILGALSEILDQLDVPFEIYEHR